MTVRRQKIDPQTANDSAGSIPEFQRGRINSVCRFEAR